jgi:hypothetical protein
MVRETAGPGEMILTLGAGDVGRLCRELVEEEAAPGKTTGKAKAAGPRKKKGARKGGAKPGRASRPGTR